MQGPVRLPSISLQGLDSPSQLGLQAHYWDLNYCAASPLFLSLHLCLCPYLW